MSLLEYRDEGVPSENELSEVQPSKMESLRARFIRAVWMLEGEPLTKAEKLAHLSAMRSGDRFVMLGKEYKVVSIDPKWKSVNVMPIGKGAPKSLTLPKKITHMVQVIGGNKSFTVTNVSIDDFKVGAEAGAHLSQIALSKKKSSLAKKSFSHDFKVGDYLYSSWGYDQTNVDFYQVVKVPSPKSIHLQKVGKKVVDSKSSADYVVPSGRPSGPVMKKIVSTSGSVKIGHNHVSKWDGKPQYQTASGYGH